MEIPKKEAILINGNIKGKKEGEECRLPLHGTEPLLGIDWEKNRVEKTGFIVG